MHVYNVKGGDRKLRDHRLNTKDKSDLLKAPGPMVRPNQKGCPDVVNTGIGMDRGHGNM